MSAKWHMGLTCHIFTATSEVGEQIGLMTYNENVQPPRDATEDTTSRAFGNCKCICCFSFFKLGLDVNLETRVKVFHKNNTFLYGSETLSSISRDNVYMEISQKPD